MAARRGSAGTRLFSSLYSGPDHIIVTSQTRQIESTHRYRESFRNFLALLFSRIPTFQKDSGSSEMQDSCNYARVPKRFTAKGPAVRHRHRLAEKCREAEKPLQQVHGKKTWSRANARRSDCRWTFRRATAPVWLKGWEPLPSPALPRKHYDDDHPHGPQGDHT